MPTPPRCLLPTFLLCLLAACGSDDAPPPPPVAAASHVAVVDAGSSGSRLYLYRATADGDFGAIDTLLDQGGGAALSGFAAKPDQAGPQGIRPLLDKLDAAVAARGLTPDQVRVHVLATAGMRHVDEDAPTAAAAIYESVRGTIRDGRYAMGEVGTISGRDEGVYSWADVNYLKGTFQARSAPYGIVEVGGASAQVVYVSTAADNPNVVRKTINGVTYPVFSISYLGLGQNDARARMAAAGGTVDNACYTSDYVFGANEGDPAPGPGVATLTGRYDHAGCQRLYRRVIEERFAGTGTPIADGLSTSRFLLVGGSFSGVLGNWGLTGRGPSSALDDMARQHCADARWDDFLARFQSYALPRFLQPQCANSTYLGTLLHDAAGLGLRADQTESVPDVGGVAATWTLGYVVMSQFSR